MHPRPPFDALSPRQQAILRHLAAGRTLPDAAAVLGLPVDVAKAEAMALCDALGVESPLAAARAWRAHHAFRGRLRRGLRSLLRLARPRAIAVVGMALLGLALLAGAVMLALVPVIDDDRFVLRADPSGRTPAAPSNPVATPTPVVLASQVDRVIRAVVDGDYLAFRALLVSLPERCAAAPSGPGAPPRCPAGVADGGEVETFRYMACERGYPEDLEPALRAALADGYRLYSASLSLGAARPAFLPGGDYRLVFVGPGESALSLEVTLGGVVSAWLGCDTGPAAMIAGIPTVAFIVQPLGQRVTGAPWVNP